MSYILAFDTFAAAWRGQQRLIVTVAGETITEVNYRADYDEERYTGRLVRLPLERALPLMDAACPTSACAHRLAFCQAVEALAELPVPERAAYVRCALAEVERMASHLAVLVELFDALGVEHYLQPLHHLQQAAAQIQQHQQDDTPLPQVVPGGLSHDLEAAQQHRLLEAVSSISRRLFALTEQVIDRRVLLARTVDTGTLARSAAMQFGVRGPLARASGIRADLRWDEPYAAYHRLPVRSIVQESGDVYSRIVVFLLEALESLKLVEEALTSAPDGACTGSLAAALPAGEASAAVESPRGLLRYTLVSNGERLTHVMLNMPHQLDRLLARTLFVSALVDNVVLIARSTDTCLLRMT